MPFRLFGLIPRRRTGPASFKRKLRESEPDPELERTRDVRACKICRDEVYDGDDGPALVCAPEELIRPCKCVDPVHRGCLETMRRSGLGGNEAIQCGACLGIYWLRFECGQWTALDMVWYTMFALFYSPIMILIVLSFLAGSVGFFVTSAWCLQEGVRDAERTSLEFQRIFVGLLRNVAFQFLVVTHATQIGLNFVRLRKRPWWTMFYCKVEFNWFRVLVCMECVALCPARLAWFPFWQFDLACFVLLDVKIVLEELVKNKLVVASMNKLS